MTERGTPVVIIFILAIGIMLYSYVAEYKIANEHLKATIIDQQEVINKQRVANKDLSLVVEYLYIKHYGHQIPGEWTELKSANESSPVH
jgi:hypothetical protein